MTPSASPAPRQQVVPLDPNSPKGREVAERLGNILAEIELGIAQREKAAREAERAA
jgi:hypothetical protein